MLRMNRYGNFQSSIIRFATKCNFSAIIHGADEAWKVSLYINLNISLN